MNVEGNCLSHIAAPISRLSTKMHCIKTMASMKEWVEPMLDRDTHGTKIEGCLVCQEILFFHLLVTKLWFGKGEQVSST